MGRKQNLERWLLLTCILLGAVQTWIVRYSMSGDGVSYLDVGDAYFRHDWAHAVNGYWSPMYSWWLGFALYVFKPSMAWEFITVHAVNFVIYLVALWCLRVFLRSLLRTFPRQDDNAFESLPDWAFLALGYAVFAWAALVLIDPGAVTPDLLVAAFVFLIGACLVDLRRRESFLKFASFGIFCGLAYLAKAFMFPLGFLVLAILLVSGKITSRRVAGVLLAGALFLLVSSPFIVALSKQKGRFTFGDSGSIAYAGMVNPGIPPTHWQGEPPGSGAPKHATHQILDDPPVFEFAEPFHETYPPWYDPSYWNDGAKGSFRLRPQIRVLVQSARNYVSMLLTQLGLITGLAIFLLWGSASSRKAILGYWPLLAAALFSMGLYSLVLVRTRYVAPFMVFLFVAMLAGIRLPRDTGTPLVTRLIVIATALSILVSISAALAETAYVTNTVYSYPTQEDQLIAASALTAMGLQAGDRVAVIGDGRTDYWARLGRFRIVAEVLAQEAGRVQFWSQPAGRRKLAYECLARTGAKLVVVWDPPTGKDPGWNRIGRSNYYAYVLNHD